MKGALAPECLGVNGTDLVYKTGDTPRSYTTGHGGAPSQKVKIASPFKSSLMNFKETHSHALTCMPDRQYSRHSTFTGTHLQVRFRP